MPAYTGRRNAWVEEREAPRYLRPRSRKSRNNTRLPICNTGTSTPMPVSLLVHTRSTALTRIKIPKRGRRAVLRAGVFSVIIATSCFFHQLIQGDSDQE